MNEWTRPDGSTGSDKKEERGRKRGQQRRRGRGRAGEGDPKTTTTLQSITIASDINNDGTAVATTHTIKSTKHNLVESACVCVCACGCNRGAATALWAMEESKAAKSKSKEILKKYNITTV